MVVGKWEKRCKEIWREARQVRIIGTNNKQTK